MSDDKKEEPFLTFRYCGKKCLEPTCTKCGWFWGPSHPRQNEVPYWAETQRRADGT